MFKAYVAMLRRLEAEEALARISEHAIATGAMAKDAHRQYVTELRRQVGSARAAKPTVSQLAAMGIRVVRDGEEVN